MLKEIFASLVIALVLLVARGQAQSPNTVTRQVTVTATVDRIEKSTRLLTLSAPGNMMQSVYVDRSVKEFDDLNVGDTVTIHYLESTVVQVRPGATLSTPRDTTDEARKTAENVTDQQKMVVTVDSVDSLDQTITYRTADGMKVFRHVADKSLIQGLHAGDRVEVTVTLERATSIERARR